MAIYMAKQIKLSVMGTVSLS